MARDVADRRERSKAEASDTRSRRVARGRESGYPAAMRLRLKKLVGMILLVALVVAYALIATTIAVTRLGQSGSLVHFTFFLLGGLVWILPAMLIIRWAFAPAKQDLPR